MSVHRYLIVGGGMAADAAVHGIRERDPQGSIALVGEEADPPYNRPPLSKGLWKGDAPESIRRDTAGAGVEMVLGRRIVDIDTRRHLAVDGRGQTYQYERALLATGGRPRRLDFGGDAVLYFRGLADYRRLRERVRPGVRIAVIGGGFIGSELAAALALNEAAVTMVFPEAGIGAPRLRPRDLRGGDGDVPRAGGGGGGGGRARVAARPAAGHPGQPARAHRRLTPGQGRRSG